MGMMDIFSDSEAAEPVIDVQAAKTALRTQIQLWRNAGWTWTKIQNQEGKLVWQAYVALGGK